MCSEPRPFYLFGFSPRGRHPSCREVQFPILYLSAAQDEELLPLLPIQQFLGADLAQTGDGVSELLQLDLDDGDGDQVDLW